MLQQVLALHPTPVTLDELVGEIAGEGEDFGQRDAVERAVRDLAGCGLLHRSEALVLPSRAACASTNCWASRSSSIAAKLSPAPFKVRSEQHDGVFVIAVEGELDMNTATDLERELEGPLDAAQTRRC